MRPIPKELKGKLFKILPLVIFGYTLGALTSFVANPEDFSLTRSVLIGILTVALVFIVAFSSLPLYRKLEDNQQTGD